MDVEAQELARNVGEALRPLAAVRVAFVFGSRITGGARSDSDLDVAVAIDPALDDRRAAEVRRDVLDALASTLGALGERADVVDLARASSAVAFRAVRDGVLALARSEAERVALVVRIARRYEDEAPARALFRRAAVRSSRGAKHG